MTQRTTGWRRILSLPTAYRLAQRAIGSDRAKSTLLGYLSTGPGDRVLDIGCGTGDLSVLLQESDYLGFDPSEEYVRSAADRHGSDTTQFRVGGVGEIDVPKASVDVCVAKGVLHHLDDGLAEKLFIDAHRALRPGGRLITMDPMFASDQSRIARLLAERDRGENVRELAGYKSLAAATFDDVTSHAHDDLLRLPYDHAFLVCVKSA